MADVLTADFVYVRCHGCGRRHGGLDRNSHLAADAADIAAWRRRRLDVDVYYSNDGQGAAIRNARRLRALTGSPARACVGAASGVQDHARRAPAG